MNFNRANRPKRLYVRNPPKLECKYEYNVSTSTPELVRNPPKLECKFHNMH